jgi:hypothetical protein
MPNKIFYNKEAFEQELLVFRVNDKYEMSDQPQDNLILFNDNIRSFKYWNDLFTGIPKTEILFEDVNNQEIAKIRCDGYAFIRISLQYKYKVKVDSKIKSLKSIVDSKIKSLKSVVDSKIKSKTDKKENKKKSKKEIEKTVTLIHDFIITSVDIVNKKADSVVYKINGISSYDAFRKANIVYSSKHVKSTTVIVEEMLKAGNYPYFKIPDLTHSSRLIKYIAPVNAGLGDCVDEILSYSSTPGTGIYYVMHHMIKNKAQIVCIRDVFNEGRIGQINYVLIPTKDDFADFERSLMDLDSKNYIPGNETYELIKPITFNNFDYLTRTWSKDKYDFQNYKDINYELNGEGSNLFQKIYKKIPKILTNRVKFSSNFEPLRYKELRARMNKLTFFSDVIQFKCTGHIQREIGELIALSSGNTQLGCRYGGLWLIVRIYHKFEGSNYYNEIIAVRSDELKPTIIPKKKSAMSAMSALASIQKTIPKE